MILRETSLYGWGVCDILMPRASRDIHTDRRSKRLLFFGRNRRRKKSREDGFWSILCSILAKDFPRMYTLLVFLLSILMILLIYWISLIIPDMPDKEIVKPEDITITIIEDKVQIPEEPEPPPVEEAPKTPEPETVQKPVEKPPVKEAVKEEPKPKPVIKKTEVVQKPKPVIKETVVVPKPKPVVIKKQRKLKPKPVIVQKKIEPPPIPKPVEKEIIPEIVIKPKIIEKAVEKIKKPDKSPIVFKAQSRTEIKLAPKMLSTKTFKKQKSEIKVPAKKFVKFDDTKEIPVDINIKPEILRVRSKKVSQSMPNIPAPEKPVFDSEKTVDLNIAPSIKRITRKEKQKQAAPALIRKNSTVARPVLEEDILMATPVVKKKIYQRKALPALQTQRKAMPDSLTDKPESPDVVVSSLSKPSKNYRGAISPVKISVPRDTEIFKTLQPASAADLNLPEADSGSSRYAKANSQMTQNPNIPASGANMNFKPQHNTEEIMPGPMSQIRKSDDRSQAGLSFSASDKMAPGFAEFLGYNVDSSHIISLRDLSICLDPEEAPELKTMLATLLDGPLTFKTDDIIFSVQYPEDKYTIHLYLYNPTKKVLKDKCSALKLAIKGVRKIKK